MFLDFFILLKNQGIPVSLREYLDLLEALKKGVIERNIEEFYFLSRSTLVKNQKHLDKFDSLFGVYFKGMEEIPDNYFDEIPDEWLQKGMEKFLSPEEMEKIKSYGDLEEILERVKEMMKEQKERHAGGSKWIGTGGVSPFGAYGYNPEGIRIGQHESRHRRAIKVWDKRTFKNLDDNVELETRNMKMALRKLRQLTRVGVENELDLEKTIKSTSKNGGMLELEMVPSKVNNVKILLLLDVGGSMDDHIALCSRLFSAARHEFKHLEYYYFHNCVYEKIWKNAERRHEKGIPTQELLNKYNKDYKIIFVGDASMSLYEIFYKHGSVEHYNEQAGIEWLNKLKKRFPDMVWLNPVKEQEWRYTESIGHIKKYMDKRMFPLTISGIDKAVKELKS